MLRHLLAPPTLALLWLGAGLVEATRVGMAPRWGIVLGTASAAVLSTLALAGAGLSYSLDRSSRALALERGTAVALAFATGVGSLRWLSRNFRDPTLVALLASMVMVGTGVGVGLLVWWRESDPDRRGPTATPQVGPTPRDWWLLLGSAGLSALIALGLGMGAGRAELKKLRRSPLLDAMAAIVDGALDPRGEASDRRALVHQGSPQARSQ